MTIKLSLTENGDIEIDFSYEPRFILSDHGLFITMAFTTVYRDKNRIIINAGNILGQSIEYVINEIKSLGFEINLDDYLNVYLKNFQNESKEIERISESKKEYKDYVLKNPEFIRKLLPYQIIGISHTIDVGNSANFSVPGSGKTSVALGAFAEWKYCGEIERILMIGPASSFDPWETEFKECFGRQPRVIRWSGDLNKRQLLLSKIKNSELILCTYQTACRDKILLEKILRDAPTLFILDESHYIKNYNGVRSNTVLSLAPFAKKRMILTGTPAPYSLSDIWTQFTFLWTSQKLLGTLNEYEFKLNQINSTEKISKSIRNFFYRTKKSDLGLSEPKIHIIKVKKSSIPVQQQKIIELLEKETYMEARKKICDKEDLDILRKLRTARIIRLLQASSNPGMLSYLVENHYTEIPEELNINLDSLKDMISAFKFPSGKIIPAKVNAVVSKTQELIKSGKKVIIWSWFIENIRLLSHLLSEYHPLLLYGNIKPYENKEDTDLEESRERNIKIFKERKDRPLIIANPAACGESISLHKHCHDAIYLDRNFNCGQFLQSMDRIHRVGLPPNTTTNYYIVIIDCAIERTVDKRLKIRQAALYKLMEDDMPIMGVEEDMWLAENLEELNLAYDELINDLQKQYE